MGHCTISYQHWTEELCLLWNYLKHKGALFEIVALSKLGYIDKYLEIIWRYCKIL